MVFLFSSFWLLAQREEYHHEISGRYDNDVFFFTDHYYTSGLELSYSFLSGEKLQRLFMRGSDSLKVIASISYGHKIFTPLKIRETELEKRDRPYAGWHYGQFSVINFTRSGSSVQYQITLGLTGPQSGMDKFQDWYHEKTNITGPIGWESQIGNELLVGLTYMRQTQYTFGRSVNLVGSLSAELGTAISQLAYDLTLRLGKSNDLAYSGFSGGRIGRQSGDVEEGFFYIGATGVYVLHNTFVEGSLWHDNDPHVEEAEKLLLNTHMGGHYSSDRVTFAIELNRLSAEVIGGRSHYFTRFELGYRF